MNQDKLFERTKRAVEIPLEFTQTLIEKSKKLRTPSAKVDKIGTTIGGLLGVGFVLVGIIQIILGKPLWAAGTLSVGVATIISNRIHSHH